jgi:hypothetical protein
MSDDLDLTDDAVEATPGLRGEVAVSFGRHVIPDLVDRNLSQ